MRLTSFSLPGGHPRPGLILGNEIVDLSDPATGLPATMAALLALGPDALIRPVPHRPAERRGTTWRRCGGTRRCPIRPPSSPSA